MRSAEAAGTRRGLLRRVRPGLPSAGAWPSLRPSVIATSRAMANMAAACFLTAGVVGFLTAWLSPDESHLTLARVISLVSLIAGAGTAAFGRRLHYAGFYVVLLCGVGMLDVQMRIQHGNSEAVAAALLLPLVSMFLFAFYDGAAGWLAEVVILGSIVAAGVFWSALPLATAATLICVNLVIAAVTGWLVRAAAEAETDGATGLLNRRGFGRALKAALESEEPFSIAILDLEHVEAAAPRGHGQLGDPLRALATEWSGLAGPDVAVARWGDESFAALAYGPPEDLIALIQTFRGDRTLPAGAATHESGDTASRLLDRALGALFEAKRAGGGRTVHSQDPTGTRAELVAALAAGEFSVAYQPIVALPDGQVVGAEALARWNRPGRGQVPPSEFIPQAELSGFIDELDRWVLWTACTEAASWSRAVPAKITVNVSGGELERPGYCAQVVAILEETGLPAGRLVLEVTESMLEGESQCALETLRALRELGIRIAIDDFGTGYSSLGRLHRLPADILKVDRSFVAPLGPEDAEAPLIGAITAMAGALGLQTVAEGVEDRHQGTLLTRYGCGEAQGWLYGRPGEPGIVRAALEAQALDAWSVT
jgi:EAL domain-containing protein (putative c-di-GMP-specific phosphodiesterase class I)/GGDEF domain-containing protein